MNVPRSRSSASRLLTYLLPRHDTIPHNTKPPSSPSHNPSPLDVLHHPRYATHAAIVDPRTSPRVNRIFKKRPLPRKRNMPTQADFTSAQDLTHVPAFLRQSKAGRYTGQHVLTSTSSSNTPKQTSRTSSSTLNGSSATASPKASRTLRLPHNGLVSPAMRLSRGIATSTSSPSPTTASS